MTYAGGVSAEPAASVSDGGHSGFAVPDSLVREALNRAGPPVGTGPCAR